MVPINTPELKTRYNAGLAELGIKPSALNEFNIDGAGWSPEIATEKKNNFYLCAGPANPMAVILTPDQREKPVYFPFHSFTRRMLKAYFQHFDHAIADITALTAIGLDIDQELTRYENPSDLMLVRSIIVRSMTGGLSEAARLQKKLVERFSRKDLSWFDQGLRQELAKSGTRFGDLRFRRLDIPDFKFEVRSFHAQVFGGVFVIRLPKSGESLLVFESTECPDAVTSKDYECLSVNDDALPEKLWSEKLVDINFKWLKDHSNAISDKKDCVLADVLCAKDPGACYIALNPAQKRQAAMTVADDLPPIYHQLERVSKQIENGDAPDTDNMPLELKILLMSPHVRLTASEQEVIQMLICRLHDYDVLRLYHADKNLFFQKYLSWSDCKKEWAVKLIRERWSPAETNQRKEDM